MTTPPAVTGLDLQEYLGAHSREDDDSVFERLAVAATAVAERKGMAGPLIVRSVTKRIESSGSALRLPLYPVKAVTAMSGVYSGRAYTAGDLDVWKEIGVVRLAGGGDVPAGPYTVTWDAGRWDDVTGVDEDVREAVFVIGKHLRETRRGAGRTGAFGGSQEVDVPAGFVLPRRAEELLAGYRQGPF